MEFTKEEIQHLKQGLRANVIRMESFICAEVLTDSSYYHNRIKEAEALLKKIDQSLPV